MSIVSLNFLYFCVILIATYFLLPKKFQPIVLLCFNTAFAIIADGWLFIYMLITEATTYVASIMMKKTRENSKQVLETIPTENQKERRLVRDKAQAKCKNILLSALFLNFGIWGVLKYSGFFVENINRVFSLFNLSQLEPVKFILPLGISYYTFQAAGYLTDIYRSKYEIETNPIKIATFISYFPHLTQGPFSRYDKLGSTLFTEHTFSYERLCVGCRRILWGLVKKLLIADKIGVAVASYFGYINYYSSEYLLIAAILFGIQTYADFSGYMDIVCGVSKILGIELEENFKRPFMAKSVEEYWRRWHITLGAWFRDYVFYPISLGRTAQKLGSKSRKKFGPRMGKLVPSYLALIFVWSLTGLWHGAAWKYIIWGLSNLFFIVLSMQIAPLYEKIKNKLQVNKYPKLWELFRVARTFLLVCMLRVISRSASLGAAILYFKRVFTAGLSPARWINPSSFFPNMTVENIIIVIIFVIVLFAVDILEETNKWDKIKEKVPGPVRSVIYAVLIAALILFAGGENDLMGGFMYAVF